MSTETANLDSGKRMKFLRHRWLWSVLLFCVLLWGFKAIHRAMQPKYQGKTAQEWFESYQLGQNSPWGNPPADAFKNLGTNAVWFVWREYCRKDSKPTAWVMTRKDLLLGTKRFWWANTHELERQTKAIFLLRELGADAEPLIPEIVSRLSTGNLDEATTMADLLGRIRRQPELVVPAIHRSLLSTNLSIGQRISHFMSLAEFGDKAKPSLPELQARLANPVYTNSGENLYLAVAILQINGPGPELGIYTNRLAPGDLIKSHNAIYFLGRCGTNALPSVPILLRFAQTLTNESEVKSVMETVRQIDPEGIYQKP